MKNEFLEPELRLLLLKYGTESVLKVLALLQETSMEELRASIARLSEKRPPKQSRRFATASEWVTGMKIESPEKAALLISLAQQFDKKTFLADLRDIRTFLHRYGVQIHSIRSRQDSTKKIFDELASLPASDLRRIEEEYASNRQSAYSELAGEIMGKRQK